jgi:RNA polymerase sigma-70 factor, ECF subfamily
MKLTTEEQRQLRCLVLPLLDYLHRLAYFLCHNQDDAEDLVAETIRKACEKFRSLRDHNKVKAWLIRILRNTFVSLHRTRNNVLTTEYDDNGQFSLFTEVSQPFLLWWGNPERELLNKMLEEDIREAISELPHEFRFVVVLCDVEGLSYKEIAKILKIPIGTVRSRLARGRSILQKKLSHHAVERGIAHSGIHTYEHENV